MGDRTLLCVVSNKVRHFFKTTEWKCLLIEWSLCYSFGGAATVFLFILWSSDFCNKLFHSLLWESKLISSIQNSVFSDIKMNGSVVVCQMPANKGSALVERYREIPKLRPKRQIMHRSKCPIFFGLNVKIGCLIFFCQKYTRGSFLSDIYTGKGRSVSESF